jgi:hypothetical protein
MERACSFSLLLRALRLVWVWDKTLPPREFVGLKANVRIEFPNPPIIEKRRRRGRKRFNYFQID